MAAARHCLTCNIDFVGRANQDYCSPACRQRAHRGRRTESVTDKRVTRTPRRRRAPAKPGGHCPEAVAILDGLDADLAAASKRIGRPMGWSRTQQAMRDLIASNVDRTAVLKQRLDACEDDHLVLKFAAEIRQLEAALARLLAQVKPNVPPVQSLTSIKAANAAHARHSRNA